MKKELIADLFLKFEQACYDFKGIECWSARELQGILGYTEWRNFIKVIDKAKDACNNAGEKLSNHFVDVNKMVKERGVKPEILLAEEDVKKLQRKLEAEAQKLAKGIKKRIDLPIFNLTAL